MNRDPFDKNSWRQEAACTPLDTNVFFSEAVGDEGLRAELYAKAICRGCPVVRACLDFAIATGQDDGIWGGTTDTERRTIRRLRRAETRRSSRLV